MSARRRERVRLEISREAARLFWEQGVDGTTGDRIAEAVGLSVRTIWRYFRNKESCAEPVVTQSVEKIMAACVTGPGRSSSKINSSRGRRVALEVQISRPTAWPR